MGEPSLFGGNVERLVRYFARLVADEIKSTDAGLKSQHGSPLGARRHRAAVERRRERGQSGAFIRGKDFLLTPQALEEELERLTTERLARGPGLAKAKPRSPEVEALDRELKQGIAAMRKGNHR